MSGKANKIYLQRILGILIVLIIGGVIYFVFSPEQFGFFPRCPFHQLTGLDCPGCGSQRAIHHLLHLEVGKALKSNLLLIIAVPYILTCTYLEYFGGKEKHPQVRKMLYSKNAILIALVSIILFWVLRNIL